MAMHGKFLVYALVAMFVFCEVGLVVTPFLPADSMIFAVGALCAAGAMDIGIVLMVLPVAAVLGDNCNRFLGSKLGHRAFARGTGKLFNDKNRRRANRFFDKYGSKAIIICRYMPFIRVYVPFVAGMSGMRFKLFFPLSVFAGTTWVFLYSLTGYFLGNIPIIKTNFEFVIIGIICVGITPMAMGWLKHRRRKRRMALCKFQ